MKFQGRSLTAKIVFLFLLENVALTFDVCDYFLGPYSLYLDLAHACSTLFIFSGPRERESVGGCLLVSGPLSSFLSLFHSLSDFRPFNCGNKTRGKIQTFILSLFLVLSLSLSVPVTHTCKLNFPPALTSFAFLCTREKRSKTFFHLFFYTVLQTINSLPPVIESNGHYSDTDGGRPT